MNISMSELKLNACTYLFKYLSFRLLRNVFFMSNIIEISTKPSKLDAMIIENISFSPEMEKIESFYSLSYCHINPRSYLNVGL